LICGGHRPFSRRFAFSRRNASAATPPFAFTGKIYNITVDVSGYPHGTAEEEKKAAFERAISSQ